jgi:hypothetical protein
LTRGKPCSEQLDLSSGLLTCVDSENFRTARATFPYKKDPRDRNIRIAPTFSPIEDIRLAMNVLATCTQLVSIDKLVAEK